MRILRPRFQPVPRLDVHLNECDLNKCDLANVAYLSAVEMLIVKMEGDTKDKAKMKVLVANIRRFFCKHASMCPPSWRQKAV